jgi:O-acetyl-ADP-ribose deacetylase
MSVLREHTLPNGNVIQVVNGDLSLEKVDIIVNSCNTKLTATESVSKAISERAGPKFLEDCENYIKNNGTLKEGSFYVSEGYKLSCKYVINAVGPQKV